MISIREIAYHYEQNPNTQEQNREYLVMMDLQSWLYFNNHSTNLNVHFDISIDGHNEGFPNLKHGLVPFLNSQVWDSYC